MKRTNRVRALPLTLLLAFAGVSAQAQGILATITLRARRHAYHNVVSVAVLPVNPDKNRALRPNDKLILEPQAGGAVLPCQAVASADHIYLTFVAHNIEQNQPSVYYLRRAENFVPSSEPIRVVKSGSDIEVFLGKSLFTRYITRRNPNNPFFYPILTSDGKLLTRRAPLEEKTKDNHARLQREGLWFTHGLVNGTDFWSEEQGAGKTVSMDIPGFGGGDVYGGFQAHTEWRTPKEQVIARDVRDVRFYVLPNGDRLMDFQIAIAPVGGPLTLADTREGMLGMAIPNMFWPDGGGHILNSQGEREEAAWDRRAAWMDCSGQIDGKTYGVAIFDSPRNLRHPQAWHTLDNGLLAVNPFGLHDIGQALQSADSYTVPLGTALTLRYRLLFHRGDATVADVAGQYTAFSDPPLVEAHW